MQKSKYLPWIVAAGFAATLAIALPVFAQTTQTPSGMPGGWTRGGHFGMGGAIPGVFGTVSAVNGTSLTVTAKTRPNATSTTEVVYTVDASSAKIMKNGTTSAVSSITVGDMVTVRGTVSGTNVTATAIRDGVMGMPGMPGSRGFGRSGTATTTPPIKGNGEPVVGGSITAISGTMLTVTNASNVTYSVDASSATIVKKGTTSTIANVAIGDNVIVQGTVNGTSVTASSVIDQGVANAGNSGTQGARVGFFGTIGNFFKHLFGF